MKGQTAQLSLFSQKAEKHIPQLVNAAYAITGNREMALSVSVEALKRAYLSRDSWMRSLPFADGLSRCLYKEAFSAIRKQRKKGEISQDWSKTLPKMHADQVRVLLMEYGCGMPTRHIACAMGIRKKKVRTISAKLSKNADVQALEDTAAMLLTKENLTDESPSGILSDFQSAIQSSRSISLPCRRLLGGVLHAILLVLLGAFVYLVCVLITK